MNSSPSLLTTKPHFMKRVISTLFLGLVFVVSNSQVDWKVSGNTVTSDSKLGTNNGYDIIFETSNIERFRLTDQGNLGIGLISPLHKLDVVGSVRFNGPVLFESLPNSQPNDEYRWLSVDQSGQLVTGQGPQILADLYKYDCRPVDQEEAPLWKSHVLNGLGYLSTGFTCPAHVGIGVEYPESELQVNGRTISSLLHVGQPSNMPDFCRFSVASNSTLNQPLLKVFGNGCMEIRAFTDYQHPFTIYSGTHTDDYFKIRENGAWDINYYGSTEEAALILRAPDENNELKELIALSGDGRVLCQALTVKRTPFWGDFVFEANYPLLTLPQVETYIAENKHLPNMPSAATIEEQGVDLYEMIRLMNIKLEELTLYAIEQERKIKELEQLVEGKP